MTASAGGIALPGSDKRLSGRGKILAIGPGKQLADGSTRQVKFHVGETVQYERFKLVELDRVQYLAVADDEVIFLVEEQH